MPFDATLFHVNADMTDCVLRRLPIGVLAGRRRIGYWFWELDELPPALATAGRLLDEVWAPTRFCELAFRRALHVPVRWVPPAVPIPTAPPADRRALGIPTDSFLFYYAFDAASVPERKNPVGLLRAFERAVSRSPKPLHLLLKVNHPEVDPALDDVLRTAAHELPVTLLCERLPRAGVDALAAAADAFVSLHRSEGLGLHLIESMYLGKPVVATAYGGVTDFFDGATGWVVDHQVVTLAESHGPYPPGARWAAPDVDSAALRMIEVARGGSEVARRVHAARARVTALYGAAAAGERMRRELVRLGLLSSVPAAPASAGAATAPIPQPGPAARAVAATAEPAAVFASSPSR
jgi:glycosyltransferase involved in cell wall biosynthesis